MKPRVLAYDDLNVVVYRQGDISSCKVVTWIINILIVGLK
jgi:hypothetical protein